MKVDVLVCTYNSGRYLDACLKSIKDNVPVNNLWVIDKYSSDDTVKIARKFNANILQSDVSLAESRKLGFNAVETPLFVNVDSDIVLCENWFTELMKFWTGDKVGCVWGVDINQHPLHKAYFSILSTY